MKLYRTNKGFSIEHDGVFYQGSGIEWDTLLMEEDPLDFLLGALARMQQVDAEAATQRLRAPIGCQEVWAAGVTYFRSQRCAHRGI